MPGATRPLPRLGRSPYRKGTAWPTTRRPPRPSPATPTPAAESGDPAVHKLLADLQTARLNDDKDGAADAVKALADLGVKAE